MANLKRRHAFRRWAPDIGENRDLDEPGLWFELATGLSSDQLVAMKERMAAPVDLPETLAGAARVDALRDGLRQRYLEAFGAYVRIAGGPHTIEGRPLEKLEDYLRIVEGQADYGQLAVKDLLGALLSFNTFGGGDELFLQRRSGGLGTTARPIVVKAKAVATKKKRRR